MEYKPDPKAFTAAFPVEIPTISGKPTYASLKRLQTAIKVNARHVPSTYGGGQHGHLGLVLPAAQYATLPGNPPAYAIPPNPGPFPDIPAGATQHQTRLLDKQHTSNLTDYKDAICLRDVLQTAILNAIDPRYYRVLKHEDTGYTHVTIQDLFAHLFDKYGKIDHFALEANDAQFRKEWNPAEPWSTIMDQIHDAQELATGAQQPYTDAQILSNAYALAFNTGMFTQDLKEWNARPAAQKTYDNFCELMEEAQTVYATLQKTTQQAGFHNANAALLQQKDDLIAAQQEALLQFANAAQAKPPPTETTDVLRDLTNKLTQLYTDVQDLKSSANKRRTRPPPNNKNYCHTHGYCVADDHTSATCKAPGPNHKKEATRANTMGGSTKGYDRVFPGQTPPK